MPASLRGTNGSFTNGILTEFKIHTNVVTNCQPTGMTVGPDGNIWFLEISSDLVGVMNTNGILLHEYGSNTIPSNVRLYNIASGPDSNLWFTEMTYGTIDRITTGGNITRIPPFPTPIANRSISFPALTARCGSPK